MPLTPFDEPSQVAPVDGEVTLRGPGAAGLSMTPGAARETAARLTAAAARAEDGHVEEIDVDDAEGVARWADRLGVDVEAVHAAVAAVGPDSEAVAGRLAASTGAAD
ncbi:DUF3606 domain-containing protein [Caulobacter segnis]